MLRTRLSRASLAALAIAALASGSTLVNSSAANAATKIDPGFSRGPARIDPGFGRGPARIDPGFASNSGLKYTVKQTGGYVVRMDCYWIDRPNGPQPRHPGESSKVKVCH